MLPQKYISLKINSIFVLSLNIQDMRAHFTIVISILLLFATSLSAQITREQADAVVLEHMLEVKLLQENGLKNDCIGN